MKFGSDYARAWSRRLRFGDVRTKSVLNAICNYVDEDGRAWPSIGTLAEDTDQSEDSVRRRLKDLEAFGCLARFPRFIDDHGKVNMEARGRRTSDELRLIFDCTQAAIDAAILREKGGVSAQESPDTAEISPSQQPGLNPIDPGAQPGADPSQQQGGRSHCGYPHNEPSVEEGSPQSPPSPDGDTAGSARGTSGEGEPPDDWLERFKSTYPEPTNRPEVLVTLSAAMTPGERERTLRGAAGAKARRAEADRQKRRCPLVASDKFLANPALWAEYERFAPPPPPPEIFVAFGSPEWRARAVRAAICGARMPSPAEIAGKGRGAIFHREVGRDTLALAGFANESGSVDTRQWLIVEKAATGADDKAHITPEFAAWGQRIKEWTGYFPQAERIPLCDSPTRCSPCWCEEPFTFQGKTTMVRGHKTGLRVPTPFPPPKGNADEPQSSAA